jgi:hypothetical protein
MRRLFKQQLEAIERGSDPINVSFDRDAPPVRVSAGRFRTPTTAHQKAG